jgi:hypothetical protein
MGVRPQDTGVLDPSALSGVVGCSVSKQMWFKRVWLVNIRDTP